MTRCRWVFLFFSHRLCSTKFPVPRAEKTKEQKNKSQIQVGALGHYANAYLRPHRSEGLMQDAAKHATITGSTWSHRLSSKHNTSINVCTDSCTLVWLRTASGGPSLFLHDVLKKSLMFEMLTKRFKSGFPGFLKTCKIIVFRSNGGS